MTKVNGPETSRQQLLTVAQVAEMIQSSERTVRRKIASGELPVVRIGRLVRISDEGLATLLGSRRHAENQ